MALAMTSYTACDRVRLYFALCGHGTAEQLAACFTADAIVYDTNVPAVTGAANCAKFWIKIRDKWGGAEWIVDSAIVQGSQCAVEWTMTGKKSGEPFCFRGCDLYRFEGHLIEEIRQFWRFDPEQKEKGLQGFAYRPTENYGLPHVRVDKRDGVAVLHLQQEVVNSMGLDLLRQILRALDIVEADTNIRGLVIRSSLEKSIFSAGLDIKELHQPSTSHARFNEFWHTLTMVLTRVLTTPLATVAAVKGQCFAGGCALALACDHRIATSNLKIGLNEVALGIAVPPYWCELLLYIVGAQAEGLLLQATMLKADEALRIGMISEVVPVDDAVATSSEPYDSVTNAALSYLSEMLEMPDHGRRVVKHRLRGEFGQRWRRLWQEEAMAVWADLCEPSCVRKLTSVLERLSPNKAKL